MNRSRSPDTTSGTDFEARARQLYRDAARDIDADTAARLRAARRRALEGDARIRPRHRWMMPAGAVAACVLAVALFWQQPRPAPHAPASQQALSATADASDSDLPPDPGGADPTLEQNLQFYNWLAHQPPPRAR